MRYFNIESDHYTLDLGEVEVARILQGQTN
jgi:hypothetical protein